MSFTSIVTPAVQPLVGKMLGRIQAAVSHNALHIPSREELPLLTAALASAPVGRRGIARTLIGLVLDRSTSMQTGCKQTIDSYNRQLGEIQANAKEVSTLVTQVVFDSKVELMADGVDPKALVQLNAGNYIPNGSTSLYDAVAGTIKRLLTHPDAQYEDTAILLSIITDGEDTTSSVWGQNWIAHPEFQQLMQAVNRSERWTVALAGPDTKLCQFAELMCVDAGNIAAFKPESVASRGLAMAGSVQAMGSYLESRKMGVTKAASLYAGTEAGAFAEALLAKNNKG